MNGFSKNYQLDAVSSIESELANKLSRQIQEEIDRKVLDEIIWIRNMHDNPDWHLVEIPWEKTHDKNFNWNEACAWAVENFGLPGENFVTHASENQMKFLFRHQEHAVLMTLKWI